MEPLYYCPDHADSTWFLLCLGSGPIWKDKHCVHYKDKHRVTMKVVLTLYEDAGGKVSGVLLGFENFRVG